MASRSPKLASAPSPAVSSSDSVRIGPSCSARPSGRGLEEGVLAARGRDEARRAAQAAARGADLGHGRPAADDQRLVVGHRGDRRVPAAVLHVGAARPRLGPPVEHVRAADAVEPAVGVAAGDEHVAVGELHEAGAEDVRARDVDALGRVRGRVVERGARERVVAVALGRRVADGVPHQDLAARQQRLEDRHHRRVERPPTSGRPCRGRRGRRRARPRGACPAGARAGG